MSWNDWVINHEDGYWRARFIDINQRIFAVNNQRFRTDVQWNYVRYGRQRGYPENARYAWMRVNVIGQKQRFDAVQCDLHGLDYINGNASIPFIKSFASDEWKLYKTAVEQLELKQRSELTELKTHKQWIYRGYLRSPEWAKLRTAVLLRDGNQCNHCGSDCNLHVHHLTYDRRGDECLNDLITLCATCHDREHGRAI
jgi:hypothetical protein